MPATTAASLNPEAGDHPVAADPRELAASQAASLRSLEEFPYYRMRYGERGSRFGDSDSSWLASLCGTLPSHARRQIRWLRVVLSSRGIPSLLLQRHLEFLHEQLVRALPENRKRYAVLRRGARELRLGAEKHLRAGRAEAIARRHDSVWRPEIPEMGALLVSAVLDERDGIERAVASLDEWACDDRRFSAQWVLAVRETIERARQAL